METASTIPDGYHDIAPGKLANVVTCLEMHARPPLRAEPDATRFSIEHAAPMASDRYRALFLLVGAEYLWSSRLLLDDVELRAILDDQRVATYVLRVDGRDAGLLELDFREPNACELGFFGIAADFIGTGAGRWLMNRAIDRAWAAPIARFWVHTCTLDHPDAIAFYRRSGFTPYKRQIEIADDPRLQGVVPAHVAPHVPTL